MNDFRTIQHRITQYHVNPPQGQQQTTGYTILRQCLAEAQALLSANFNSGSAQGGSSPEQTKRQLQRWVYEARGKDFPEQNMADVHSESF